MESTSEQHCRGNTMDEIYRGIGKFDLPTFAPIEYSDEHKVLFELPITENKDDPPKPHIGKTKWDSDHVRLPCAKQNTLTIDGEVSLNPNS